MSDYAVSNPGLKQGGAADDLFYKKWSGEIITSFNEKNIMAGRHMTKTIQSGKSAAFPYIGKADSFYHVKGKDIFDDSNNFPQEQFDSSEKIISIDAPLMSKVLIADIDEIRSEYDVRAPYTEELASALARKYDKQRLQLVALGAQASAPLTGSFTTGLYAGGTVINGGATIATSVSVLIENIRLLSVAYDEKDVPTEGRYLALKPAQYSLLANSNAVNTDFNPGGNGSLASGKTFSLYGFEILVSNNIPTGVIAAETGVNNTYNGTFTGYIGLAWQFNALGTVNLRDITMESKYFMEKDAFGIKVKKVCGAGFLLPGACGALTSN